MKPDRSLRRPGGHLRWPARVHLPFSSTFVHLSIWVGLPSVDAVFEQMDTLSVWGGHLPRVEEQNTAVATQVARRRNAPRVRGRTREGEHTRLAAVQR